MSADSLPIDKKPEAIATGEPSTPRVAPSLIPPGQSTSGQNDGVPPSQLAPTPPLTGKEEGIILFALDSFDQPAPSLDDSASKKVGWITTFADLCNLLLCFFVLLFASSRLDLERFRLIAQSMSSAMSGKAVIYVPIPVEESRTIPPPPQEPDMTNRLRRTLEYANQLRTVMAPEISLNQLDIFASDQMIVIQILQNGSFETGSSSLNPNFLSTARKIRNALADVPGDIIVAGHTDNQPVNGGNLHSNWELSSARAFSLLHELLKDNVLPGERFVLKGYGDTQPRLPNTTQENREKNRRVEIIIDQSSLKDDFELTPSQ